MTGSKADSILANIVSLFAIASFGREYDLDYHPNAVSCYFYLSELLRRAHIEGKTDIAKRIHETGLLNKARFVYTTIAPRLRPNASQKPGMKGKWYLHMSQHACQAPVNRVIAAAERLHQDLQRKNTNLGLSGKATDMLSKFSNSDVGQMMGLHIIDQDLAPDEKLVPIPRTLDHPRYERTLDLAEEQYATLFIPQHTPAELDGLKTAKGLREFLEGKHGWKLSTSLTRAELLALATNWRPVRLEPTLKEIEEMLDLFLKSRNISYQTVNEVFKEPELDDRTRLARGPKGKSPKKRQRTKQ